MNKSAAKISFAALTALGTVNGLTHNLQAAIVINEVYGGGGTSTNTAAAFNQDFVELINNGLSPQDVTGLVVEYASATSTSFSAASSSNSVTLPTFTLAAGQTFLIAGSSPSTNYLGAALPASDSTSPLNLSATDGAIGLFASANGTLLDLVGYGTAKLFEGTTGATAGAPKLSVATSDSRVLGVDTNSNSADFPLAATPTPENAAGVIGVAGTPEPTALGLVAAGSALLIGRRNKRS